MGWESRFLDMRVQDWDVILGKYLAAHVTARFEYGINDCCRFAAGAVLAMTGIDVMAGISYSNRVGALRVLREFGGLEAAAHSIMARHGFPEIEVLRAQRGDMIIADLPKPCVGILGTDGWNGMFLSAEGHIIGVPLDQCRLAWRIA